MSKRFIQFTDWIAHLYPEFVAEDTNGILTPKKDRILSRTFTFQVTDACNLACKYCYQINKKTRKLSFETAKLAVDKLLSGEDGFRDYINPQISPAIVLEFIGGEPFLEIDLIDQIVDYFRLRTIELNHPWAERFCISICSNGILYTDPKVQKFLQKNAKVLSFSVTVDGTKELHDSCRVFPDGSPSYDLAHSAAMDWMSRGYYMGSKITIAPGNVTYVADSLKAMVEDGYHEINANCVYEEGWTEEHAKILYDQCKDFTDWFLERDDCDQYAISLLDDLFGMPLSTEYLDNWCGGVGQMLSVDPDGYLYPCIRYMESSLGDQRPPLRIGNVWDGICSKQCEKDCLACMNAVDRRTQSTDACFYCPIAKGCSWCSAYNYQVNGTVDKRVTYICVMHKARVLALNYFWNKYHEKKQDGKVFDLWVPRIWAVPIIGEEEYNFLSARTKRLGGYVNENAIKVQYSGDKEIPNPEDVTALE